MDKGTEFYPNPYQAAPEPQFLSEVQSTRNAVIQNKSEKVTLKNTSTHHKRQPSGGSLNASMTAAQSQMEENVEGVGRCWVDRVEQAEGDGGFSDEINAKLRVVQNGNQETDDED